MKRGLLFLGILAVGCAPKKEVATSTEPVAVTVTVSSLKIQAIRRTIPTFGTLNGYEEVVLAPKVDGRVVAIRADVGDLVSPGTSLLELESTDYVLAVAEAKQALNAELAKLGLEQFPSGDLDVERVPGVVRSAVAVEDAERRFKQKKDLYNRQAASKDEYDLAETETRLAVASKAQVVTEAKATLAAARLRKATYDLAEQRLKDCKLVVPTPTDVSSSGLKYAIAERMLSEGTMVRSMPVTNAFKLVLTHTLKLRVMVPERFSTEVKVGQTAEVVADAVPGKSFAGKIARVNPTIEPLNRTFQVEIEIANPDGVLKTGGFAKANILTRSEELVPTVPPEAIVSYAGVNKIFVIEGDKAKAVEVQIVSREKTWIEVRGPLPEKANVVTSGQSQLVDGSLVKIREMATDERR